MNPDGFWKGKRVLVTGGDGFMGSHLTERLLACGAAVSVLVRKSGVKGSPHRFKNISHIRQSLKMTLAVNIAEAGVIQKIVKNNPQVIFHLAAEAYVPFSFEHPLKVMEINLQGTLHVLEAARQIKNLDRVVCTSSSEIYGTALTAAIRETHPLNPASPYAASKAAADRVAYAYARTYGLPVAIIRPFNTYGPRQPGNVIDRFLRLAQKNEPITLDGDGLQSRDFTYVDDMIDAFLVMGRHPKALGAAVHFGSGRELSMKRLAHRVVQCSGSRSPIVHRPQRRTDVRKLCASSALAKKLFGWKSRVGIEDGLERTLRWMRSLNHS